MSQSVPSSVDEYILQFPPEIQQALQKVRKAIHAKAKNATECISYKMPTLKFHNTYLHFAGYSKHIGLYAVPTDAEEFREEFSDYITGRGSIQFPLKKPIPTDLIERIVAYKIKNKE